MWILIGILVVVIALWAIGQFYLAGPDLSRWDRVVDPDSVQSFSSPDGPSEGHIDVVREVQAVGVELRNLPQKPRLRRMREYADEQGARHVFDGEIRPVDAGGVPAEWLLAPGADSRRRILYIHGGAFVFGSPVSHRAITMKYAEMCRAAVLAIDYRLQPENSRVDGIEDCRAAYRWILENGPDGPEALDHLVVSGDSAGGNLSLSLSAWVRDQGLRAPDSVVAFSPTVDGTFSSPSIEKNMHSDIMLGPLFSSLLKMPRALLRWFFVLQHRHRPDDPVVSPIFADLSGLPPTLIQVSEAEMMLDDARRYVNKARASGTRAVLQSWAGLLHVWQIFYPDVKEARDAFDAVGAFIDSTR